MVLYHAVSSYQLLEVMLHRHLFHKKERAVLLLPDFIRYKYPQYQELISGGFFEEVYLFPYMGIPHINRERVADSVQKAYRETVPWKLEDFRKIYVAGAHFYFSLLLIKRGIPFIFFEDSAGMLSSPERLKKNLEKRFPLHGALAWDHGLFTGENPYITSVICLKKVQSKNVSDDRYVDFSVEDALIGAGSFRKQTVRFFIKKPVFTLADTILLTQHFAGLGEMTMEEQAGVYRSLREGILKDRKLIIKKHPDDLMDYSGIFPGVQVIRRVFPSELLPYVFWKKPKIVYSVSSTGCANLRKHFNVLETGSMS